MVAPVTVSSSRSHLPIVLDWTTPPTAKAAVLHLTPCSAVDLGEHGIRINSVSPGFVPTGIRQGSRGELVHSRMVQSTPSLPYSIRS
ncbi:SDR family oxidoreductase [Streptomyces sp. NPDC057717]|uniref:SDR family oxidoreductase n=1 Tax=Streptomyces sp. NPDC057717 TaxID=3346224 RepID=UPI00367D0562